MPKKDMTGVLFKNKEKKTDKHPDYKGESLLGGVEYWLAGWINDNEKVGKYMALKFTEKEEKKQSPDSDIPF